MTWALLYDDKPGRTEEGFRVRSVQCGRWRCYYETSGDNGEVCELHCEGFRLVLPS